MTLFAFSLGAALALSVPDPAAAAGVPFTGHTGADAALVKDAMAEVNYFAAGPLLKCSDVRSVDAAILPDGWQPTDPNFRVNQPGTRYERWTVSMCGKTEPFLVSFWTDSKAGNQFMVAHPFPAGPAAKP